MNNLHACLGSGVSYLHIFFRFRAVCWKNARFSFVQCVTYKQVSGYGIITLGIQEDEGNSLKVPWRL